VARHLVCLTFDFDTYTGFVARGMTTPTPISRGEFGIVGAKRILKLFAEQRIPTTWFIPGVTIAAYPDDCQRVVDAGHEIGHHGYTHVPPAALSREQEEDGLLRANAMIEKLAGKRARGYRSPSWDLSAHTLDLLLAQGFLYDSSLMGDDHTPYRARRIEKVVLDEPIRFGPPTKLIEMPISWSLDDYPHFEFVRTPDWVLPGLSAAEGVLGNWTQDFLYMVRTTEWGVLTYTFHPYVIGRGHRMAILERLIRTMQEHGAVFCTMEQAAREWMAAHPHPEDRR